MPTSTGCDLRRGLGALLVVSFAKAFAYALGKPLIAVNHIRGHMAAAYLDEPGLRPPFVTLLASGGHTAILYAKSEAEFEILGSTLDDAAGEAFDKVARVLGLRYPGGPNIEACARGGRPIVPMPKMLKGGGGFDFSYSGLKTAVINYCHTKEQKGEEYSKADVAASFQCAAIDVLGENRPRREGEGRDDGDGGRRRRGEYHLRESLKSACAEKGFLVLPKSAAARTTRP
ncbi:MAG: tRNA (adenosine(37)-N6)-threonylcarbamoyltransferase complex transferase subunit TsaD [Christensenellaceae bacterium]